MSVNDLSVNVSLYKYLKILNFARAKFSKYEMSPKELGELGEFYSPRRNLGPSWFMSYENLCKSKHAYIFHQRRSFPFLWRKRLLKLNTKMPYHVISNFEKMAYDIFYWCRAELSKMGMYIVCYTMLHSHKKLVLIHVNIIVHSIMSRLRTYWGLKYEKSAV